MLDVSRFGESDHALHFELCPVNELIKDIFDEEKALACRKNQQLLLHIEDNTLLISADIVELKRVIRHLLVNAINYTDNGGTIEVRPRKCGDELLIEVSDTGIGIHADNLQRIFDPFFRADKARGTATGGAGLGLTIAKVIIEAHHGRIEVESKIGQGSKFKVWLPCSTTAS
jgi:two-component system phosphate regulon sensor histidine kinase PhoR